MIARARQMSRTAALTAAMIALVVAIALVAFVAGYRPVVITTGSMGPAAPEGSLIVAHQRAAQDAGVGDIIVMERTGAVTVTHRIVEVIELPDGRSAAVTRGDANPADDPVPYPLQGQVLVAVQVVPVLGTVVGLLGHPSVSLLIIGSGLALLFVASRARRTVAAALLVVAGFSAATLLSVALFTDTAAVSEHEFTTGTLDITASPVEAVVTMSSMVPGDSVTAPLRVFNDGSIEFRYSMRSTTTEDALAGFLELTVKTGVSSCDGAGWSTDGTVLYRGPLGATSSAPILGSPAPGADPGDRVLRPGQVETLCLHVELPITVGNGAQTLATSATFTFDAEQTANNP